jgi:nucleotide-binding universal stress UspA family protein
VSMRKIEEPIIIVGVDGSERSIAALTWAAGYARATGGRIRVITGYTIPITIFVVPTYNDDDYRRDAQEVLDQTLDQVGGVLDGIDVSTQVLPLRPALALFNAAEEADLVVVGSHGHHGFPGMHLGSTASFLVHHSPCPVVVCR